jgi:hypothetical protein
MLAWIDRAPVRWGKMVTWIGGALGDVEDGGVNRCGCLGSEGRWWRGQMVSSRRSRKMG